MKNTFNYVYEIDPSAGGAFMAFLIRERTTEQVILSNISNQTAKIMCNTLNHGGGFNGNTPSFFLAKAH